MGARANLTKNEEQKIIDGAKIRIRVADVIFKHEKGRRGCSVTSLNWARLDWSFRSLCSPNGSFYLSTHVRRQLEFDLKKQE